MANRSSFVAPDYVVDTFTELYDLPPDLAQDAARLQELKMTENKTQSEIDEMNNLEATLQAYLITPERWNHFQDALTNMQNFMKNEVDGYIQTKQNEFDTTIDNKSASFQTEIDKFTYMGEYDSQTTYNKKNIVSYNGQGYICVVDGTINITPDNSSPNWGLISKQGAKGDKGDRGADGLNFVMKGTYDPQVTYEPDDAVEYNGSLYYCKQTSTGILPTNTTYWGLAVAKGASILLTRLKNTVTINSDQSNVSIGISEFNQNQDILFVYANSTFLQEDVDYTINSYGDSIDKISGTWKANTEFNFIVLKNMQQDLVYTDGTMIQDGTISKLKLDLTLQSEIDNKATKNELQTTDDKIGDLSNLTTIDKTSIVSAINEVKSDNNLSKHTNNTNNPHNVTPSQIGAETPEGAQSKANTAETNAKNASYNKIAVYKEDADVAEIPYILTDIGTLPSGDTFWHIYTKFYSSTTGNRAQIAQGHSNDLLYIRHYKDGTWTSWKKIALDDEVVHNTGIERIEGTKIFANNVYWNGGADNLDSLKSSVSNGKIQVRDAITGKGGTVADGDGDGIPTFQELTNGVNSITTGASGTATLTGASDGIASFEIRGLGFEPNEILIAQISQVNNDGLADLHVAVTPTLKNDKYHKGYIYYYDDDANDDYANNIYFSDSSIIYYSDGFKFNFSLGEAGFFDYEVEGIEVEWFAMP